MDFHELWILCGLAVMQALVGFLIKRHFESPNAIDTYILSDSNGHKIKFKVKRNASNEERTGIFNEKLREMEQLQTA